MKGKIMSIVLMMIVGGAIFVNGLTSAPKVPGLNETLVNSNLSVGERPLKFNSPEEIKNFLDKNTERGGYRGYFGEAVDMAAPGMLQSKMAGSVPMAFEETTAAQQSAGLGADEFSTTNIQIAGVDEADIVKNDGRYIYALSKNKVFIIDAYPPEKAEIVSTIKVRGQPLELFINNDRLIVLGNDFNQVYPSGDEKRLPQTFAPEEVEPYPGGFSSQETDAWVYDISDRTDPEFVAEISVDGNYFDSRMIGEHVYLIANQYDIYYYDEIAMPEVRTTSMGTTDAETLDVYYFDRPDYSYTYTNVIAFDTQSEHPAVNGKTYLLGSAQNMFVSPNNIYITYESRYPRPYLYERVVDAVIGPLVPEAVSMELKEITSSNRSDWDKEQEMEKTLTGYMNSLSRVEQMRFEIRAKKAMEPIAQEITKKMERTVVHRIWIDGGDIEFAATGEVPGRVLNQFSMDEFQGYFRIATTTGHVTGRGVETSSNHIYVLDKELEIVGALEDLAPGEKIYSARFMGKRAYLVTFQKVDPLFVVDLATPEEPRVLGKLKIPGYSDYLHPYDETHIIGLGKEAVEAKEGDFAWYQGVKLALFDVSDVERPKEISKVVIGDRGTDSYALQDHKAFLFNREKNLLVIPISLAEIDYEKYPRELPPNAYGDHVWQGVYVFRIDAEEGLRLAGRVTHVEDETGFLKSGRYYYGSENVIRRSLFMDDILYTISDGMVKMNGLWDLEEKNRVYL